MKRDNLPNIVAAAERWKHRCLLAGGSVFTDEKLWTSRGFGELDRYFVQNLDAGEGDFFQKLEVQLAPAAPETKRLAAELLWVLFLPVRGEFMLPATKRDHVRRVWKWSGAEGPPESHPELDEELLEGLLNPGTGYHTHRWRELRFFILAMEDWFGLDRPAREVLLRDPWRMGEWLDGRESSRGRQLRHVLLFLLFPDHYEPIVSTNDKWRILQAFSDRWKEPVEADRGDRLAVDRRLLEIRRRLEKDRQGETVDFYEPELKSIWKPDTEPVMPPPDPPDGEAVLAFEREFGDAGAWILAAGQGGRLWPEFRRDGIGAIGWDGSGDLAEYESRDAVHEELREISGGNPIHDSLALWQFSHEMKEGDVVVAKSGRHRLLGYGRVAGAYRFEPDRAEYQHVLPIDWEDVEPVDVPEGHGAAPKTLIQADERKAWIVGAIRRLRRQDTAMPPSDPGRYTLDDALDGLFLSADHFRQILDALGRRKNVILQGPPGVGKTFVARRVAWALIGARRAENVEMVQFHQSYAYEDFVQGWRPTATGGFEVRNGVFYAFCERARRAPGERFVFVIDEINRGNLSRILGELLMLIEGDKRGPEHEIPLTYSPSGERFSVPENVYLLGLMNTADRSLAMVDYALRRRFAFVTLPPAFGTEAFREHLLAAEVDADLVRLIDERMRDLNEKIRGDVKNLGPGSRSVTATSSRRGRRRRSTTAGSARS